MCAPKDVGTYNYTFKSVVFESVKVKSVKIFFSQKPQDGPKRSFERRFENDTFESVFFKSLEIESVVVVSAHPLSATYPKSAHFWIYNYIVHMYI